MEAEILAKVIRGETIESIHRGHIVIEDGVGNIVDQVGDPSMVTFFRSACKPFQAMPLITSGAADAFGFTTQEIALSAASHSGEKMHVELAARMLSKIGLSESDLRCGVHPPFNDPESERMLRADENPTQLHNNCSGKHAAMLAVARHIGADIMTYDQLNNPVQQSIFGVISAFAEVPVGEIKIGIDGCAAPNFALPISAMAKSFANLVFPPVSFENDFKDASNRIVSAMIAFPELIGGSGRLDTMIMQAAPGKIVSKVGADGVWLCGVLPNVEWPSGLGIALKIEDGDDNRGRPVVAVEILRRLEIIQNGSLAAISPMAVTNRRGDVVGRIEPGIPEHFLSKNPSSIR